MVGLGHTQKNPPRLMDCPVFAPQAGLSKLQMSHQRHARMMKVHMHH